MVQHIVSFANGIVDVVLSFLLKDKIMSIVKAETLLVGHGLENDLKALRMVHRNVLDTAVLFPHPQGPPWKSALKILAQRYLRKHIQDGSHDSVDDARAAMDLVLLKIKNGTYCMP